MSERNLRPEVKAAHELMPSDPARALVAIDEALAADPGDPQAHYVKGQILAFHLGHPAEACPHLERAYKSVVENGYFVPGAHRAYAKCLVDLDEHVVARAVLDGCLALYPDELDAWFDRAELSRHEGLFAAALHDVDEVLARNPKHAVGLYNRACYLALAGEADRALDALEVALAATPGDRAIAREDDDFLALRQHARFTTLTS